MNLIEIIVELAKQNKYPILFLLYLVEGPNAGIISAAVASTGQLNIYAVFFLLAIAEIIADLFYYYLGKTVSVNKLQKRLSKYENNGFLHSIKEILTKNPVKALIFVKMIGVIAVPSLILIGKYQTIKPKKFLWMTSLISMLRGLIIVFLGYSLGVRIEKFLIGYDIYMIVGGLISVIATLYILFKIYRRRIQEITIKILKEI